MFFTLSFCVYAASFPLNCFNDSPGSLLKPYLCLVLHRDVLLIAVLSQWPKFPLSTAIQTKSSWKVLTCHLNDHNLKNIVSVSSPYTGIDCSNHCLCEIYQVLLVASRGSTDISGISTAVIWCSSTVLIWFCDRSLNISPMFKVWRSG